MINYAFIGATWLIGLVGIGGAIAVIAGLVFLGPAAVSAIVQPLVARFVACRWCDVALATLLALIAAYWIGHHAAAAECRADALAQELASKNADLANAKQAKDDATNRANAIEANADVHAKTDAAYIAKLQKRPSCALDGDDIGGMRVHGFRFTLPATRTK